MKIIFTIIGGIFLALALISLAVGFEGGLTNGSFQFASVNETVSAFIPNGMRNLRAISPEFMINLINLISKQIAVLFFGIVGGFIVLISWGSGNK